MSKILIVDDHSDLTELLAMALKRHGFKIATAHNKGELVDKIKIFEPDLILLDILHGDTDGRELCKEIKKTKPYVFIVLLSANPELLVEYELCNADDIIEKPFNIHGVCEMIKKMLN